LGNYKQRISLLQLPSQQRMKKSRHSKRYSRLLATLRQARQEAGLTQKEVAAKFGTHPPFVSKCESGERRIDVIELADFCRIYGISLHTLLLRAEVIKASSD